MQWLKAAMTSSFYVIPMTLRVQQRAYSRIGFE